MLISKIDQKLVGFESRDNLVLKCSQLNKCLTTTVSLLLLPKWVDLMTRKPG